MSFLSKIAGMIPGIPWVKVGLIGLLVSGILYGVHVIKLSGAQESIINQLRLASAQQHEQDTKTIQALKDQYGRDILALNKERADAVQLAQATQQELDAIKNSKPGDDANISPVLSNTLSWLRGGRNPGNSGRDTKSNTAHGIAYPSKSP